MIDRISLRTIAHRATLKSVIIPSPACRRALPLSLRAAADQPKARS
jgi:hypothetical protein